MCGRYAASRDAAELVEEFDVQRKSDADLKPDFNVAPTKRVYLIADRRDSATSDSSRTGGTSTGEVFQRELATARWGLVPSWAKDPKIGNRMINARLETIASKPSFRSAFAKRRCLLPADGYYEWYRPTNPPVRPGGSGAIARAGEKPPKQPYFIHPVDGSTLAMAGLYEFWRDPEKDQDDPAAWLRTTTVITTRADAALKHIHDRMPVCIAPENWSTWLDPRNRGEVELEQALSGLAEGWLQADPISTAVNSVRNNGPELLRPIPLT